MKPYSKDLRLRVLAAVDARRPREEVAKTFSVSVPTIKRWLNSERDEEVRGLWRWLASHFEARRLVFVDESGFNISMTRLRARAPRGKRAYGKVPRNRGKNTTLIAAITLSKEPWASR
jgi:DDE superfamily endonuclease/Homeodomain-like domain